MKSLLFTFVLLGVGSTLVANSRDGSRDNPRKGEPAPPLPAMVLFEEIREKNKGRISSAQLEAQLSKMVGGRKGDATTEATMAHQLSLLSAYFRTIGEMRLTVEFAEASVKRYRSAEKALNRQGAPVKHQARMAANIAHLQEDYLGDPLSAGNSYARAIALDPAREDLKRRKQKLDRDRLVKTKPGRGGRD